MKCEREANARSQRAKRRRLEIAWEQDRGRQKKDIVDKEKDLCIQAYLLAHNVLELVLANGAGGVTKNPVFRDEVEV